MKAAHPLISILLAGAFSVQHSQAQYLVSSEFLSETPTFLLGFINGIEPQYDVSFYKLTYRTVNTAGDTVVCSGAVAVPQDAACNAFPLAVYCHGTVLRQLDVPSEQNLESWLIRVFASTGYVALAPDYVGLGENPGRHPYLHAATEATATLDMIRATNEFLSSLGLQNNGQTFITGYSQGGHAAMAALKYAQDNNLIDELNIVAGAPCSGPYNLSGSQADILLSDAPYTNPGYVIYLLMSYNLAYGNLYNELGDVIQAPYDSIVQPYFDGQQNSYDMDEVNALLPDQLSELMHDSVIVNFSGNSDHPLAVALALNDNFNWTPQVPIRMFYCTGDEQVNYLNSTAADSAMNANGAADVQAINSLAGATHGECVQPALTDAFQFFSSLANFCPTAVKEDGELLPLKVFPNPSLGVVTLEAPERGRLFLQTVYGRIIESRTLAAGIHQLDWSAYPSGTYICTLEAADGLLWRQRVILQ